MTCHRLWFQACEFACIFQTSRCDVTGNAKGRHCYRDYLAAPRKRTTDFDLENPKQRQHKSMDKQLDLSFSCEVIQMLKNNKRNKQRAREETTHKRLGPPSNAHNVKQSKNNTIATAIERSVVKLLGSLKLLYSAPIFTVEL